MLALSNRQQSVIAAILLLFTVATRGQHFTTLNNLPGASWAMFFLAGCYLRPIWILPAALLFIWGIDFTPLLMDGSSLHQILSGGKAFCLTPSYFFLVPAYTALWVAGRWYAQHYQFEWYTLVVLIASAFIGATFCELFSSGGFYFFSGRFANPTLSEFTTRIVKYYPSSLQSLAFYLGITAVIHVVLRMTKQAAQNNNTATS